MDATAAYGTFDNPAVSCRDLSLESSTKRMKNSEWIYSFFVLTCDNFCHSFVLYFNADENYHIDPNGGSNLDAVEATCRKINNEWFTCVQLPTELEMVRIHLFLYCMYMYNISVQKGLVDLFDLVHS